MSSPITLSRGSEMSTQALHGEMSHCINLELENGSDLIIQFQPKKEVGLQLARDASSWPAASEFGLTAWLSARPARAGPVATAAAARPQPSKDRTACHCARKHKWWSDLAALCKPITNFGSSLARRLITKMSLNVLSSLCYCLGSISITVMLSYTHITL